MSQRAAPNRLIERWQTMLLPLGREVATVLGNWLDRLDSLFGSLDALERQPSDQLDGYDGISRRGSPERLLLSEWALARQHPNEFLRRVSMSEQLHYEFARATERRPTQKSIVLFDAGPSQLGTPRLAHLALLLLLHRRASERGIDFAWGILQQPAPGLRSEFGIAACRRLLEARTAAAPGPEEFERWTARLEERISEHSEAPHEIVVVSDQHPTFGRVETAHVTIEESETLEEESLVVRLRRSGRPERSVVLPLPPQAMRAVLLRVSEQREARLEARTRTLDPDVGLVFSRDGQRLVARERSGRLSLYACELSNESRRATPLRGFELSALETLLAVGGSESQLELVVRDERGRLLVRHCPPPASPKEGALVLLPARSPSEVSPGDRTPKPRAVPLIEQRGADAQPRWAFAHAGSVIVYNADALVSREPGSDVVLWGDELVRLVREGAGADAPGRWRTVSTSGEHALASCEPFATRGYLAAGPGWTSSNSSAPTSAIDQPWVVIEVGRGRFRTIAGEHHGELTVRDDETVIAAIDDSIFWPLLALSSPRTPGLLLLSGEQTELVACFPEIRLTVLRSDWPLEAVSLSPDGRTLALLGAARGVELAPLRVVADELWAVAGRVASS